MAAPPGRPDIVTDGPRGGPAAQGNRESGRVSVTTDYRTGEPAAEDQRPQGEGSGSVTIACIAEAAGVSIPTVSKVLNRRTGVSDQTRARVEEFITLHGYRKPIANRSNTVELLFRELESMWATEVIRGVERVARKHRFGLTVTESLPATARPGPLRTPSTVAPTAWCRSPN